jgi:hypothetical protein
MLKTALREYLLYLSVISALFAYPSKLVFAAPAISGVSGKVSNNAPITVSGSGFGTKSTAAPIKFDNFENGINGATLSSRDPSWQVYADTGKLYSNITAHSGSLSVGNHITNGESFNTNYFTYTPSSTEMYITYWYTTTNADSGDNTIIKLPRINSSTAAGGGGIYNGPGNTSLGGTYNIGANSGPYMAYNNGAESEAWWPTWGSNELAFPPRNTWHRVEMYKKLSTPGVGNGRAFIKIFNVAEADTGNVAITRSAGYSFLLDTVFMGLADGAAQNHDYYMYLDDMYIDSTQARIEICNTNTWAARTHCEIQPATAWSASSIIIKVNRGSFGPSDAGFLYIVDSTGVVNINGYAIKFDDNSVPAPTLRSPTYYY